VTPIAPGRVYRSRSVTARLASALLLMSLLALVAQPASGATKRAPCAAKKSKTLAATERARVFRWRVESPESYYVYGCNYRRNQRWQLDYNQTGDGPYGPFAAVRLITLAGRYAAWANDYSDRVGNKTTVSVVDLTTGATRRSWVGGAEGLNYYNLDWDATHRHVYSTTDLVVKRRGGAAAWIALTRVEEPGGGLGHTVFKSDATGHGVALDSGGSIDRDSLALAGSTVYWTSGGEARSAPLY